MAFQKGHISWNKGKEGKKGLQPWMNLSGLDRTGKNHSQESKRKISIAHKGKKKPPRTQQWKIKQRLAHLGKKHTEETKKKMSERMNGGNSASFKKGQTPWITGKRHSEQAKQKISEAHIGKMVGEKHPQWKGGVTPLNEKIRHSFEYKLWREAVFKRDNFTCVWCKQRGGNLNADHIKLFAFFPELRFELFNGRTLCKECHAWKTKMDMKIWKGKVLELNYDIC